MSTTIAFLGAARTVTGSRFLIDTGTARVLVDCGMFQGQKHLRERNWAGFPIDPSTIDALVLSHAHLDHVGYTPAIVKQGFTGTIHSTKSTKRLAEVVLADSGRIQEYDAERANRKGYTKHQPAMPLYTEQDAMTAMQLFATVPFHERRKVADGVHITLYRAGHILGSASILVDFDNGTEPVYFSGDLGRPGHPVLLRPDPPPVAGTIVTESTYGDEEHLEEDGTAEMGRIIAETAARGGSVVIPAFAVDRTEVILAGLKRLTDSGSIPPIRTYLDSPMARRALGLYLRAVEDGDPEVKPEVRGHPEIFDPGDLRITESVDDSKAINHVEPPVIIISASGMATGGRVLHHLKRVLPDPKSAVILVGYQAAGTRGRRMLEGQPDIRIHGEDHPVRASIHNVPAFSVHADRSELLDWLRALPEQPDRVIAVHGDEEASEALVGGVQEELGWSAFAPHDEEVIELT